MQAGANGSWERGDMSAVTTATLTLASGDMGIVAVIALIFTLVIRELGGAGLRTRRKTPAIELLLRTWNAPILALFVVFVVILALRVQDVLT